MTEGLLWLPLLLVFVLLTALGWLERRRQRLFREWAAGAELAKLDSCGAARLQDGQLSWSRFEAGRWVRRNPVSALLRASVAHALADREAAIAWLLAPHLFTTRDVHVHVDCGPGAARGRTVVDRWERSGARPNARLLETLDAEGFFALLGESLAALP
jgi:hypothetical protein